MAQTSIYLTTGLLAELDREAHRRGISRNRLVNLLLRAGLKDRGEDWSPALFPLLHDSALEEP